MTTVYFVRHAEPNYQNHVDRERELTAKGLEDRKLVTAYLINKNIGVILSSPYQRAVDTVQHLADAVHLKIRTVEDFRERKVGSGWIEDFDAFSKKQWTDFSYQLTDGETLDQVQSRNIRALFEAVRQYAGQNIVIGSHGTALSTIIHYFNRNFDYSAFQKIQNLFPWIVKFTFSDGLKPEIQYIDVFTEPI